MTRTRLTALAATAALAATGDLMIAAPASAAVTCASPVWKAQYFGNSTFSGTPKLTACDSAVNENYGYGDPTGVTLPKDNFSVRWSLTRDFGSGGPFRLSAATQDGMRVYVDGVQKINLWKNVSTTARKTVDLTVPAGKHTLRVDYVAWTGLAHATFTYAPRTEAAVDTVKPLAPTGLTAAYNRDTAKTTLRWAANKEMDLAGYRVYRRLGTAQWVRVGGSSPLASPSFVDATPATGQTFLYEVRAVDKAGRESVGSLDATAVTVDRTGPAAPTALTVTGDAWWATLAWQGPADAATYEVYAASAATGPFELLGTTTTTSYRTDAPVNTARFYRVRALDALGNPSAYAAVTGDGVDRTPPKSPTSLGSVVRVGYTDVYWKQPDGFYEDFDNGGTYRVYRSPGKTLDPAALTRVTCAEESDETSTGGLCHDLDMPAGTYVTYAVAAVDPAGNESALSAPLVVRTGDRVAPGPVTGVTATPRADGVLMSWAASTEDDVERYVVWTGVRQGDGTVKWLSSTSCREGTSDPLAVLCGDLPDGETYVYAVVARDLWGNALPPSDPKVTVVQATELDVRPSVTVTGDWDLGSLGHGTVIGGPDEDGPSISWRCDRTAECDTVAGYRVSRWNAATQAYEPLHAGLLPAQTRAYTDTTAARGTTHFYTLEAVRADGGVAGTYVWNCVFQDRV
ncbi:PA14 domain-containing protein [Streptomyces sp. NBC_00080]|uniref:fibronectin type III domain-containing protein n=1 Tax=unclassified Streptomyces TaxID=2593676 RepID=UPI00114DF151|nr:PA14 domain-containing protein [Streptomyces sp. SLBN-115]TQJ37472.1 fibronectin type 3 domain-containing protein [Streptomyces sp. SLBN-115]